LSPFALFGIGIVFTHIIIEIAFGQQCPAGFGSSLVKHIHAFDVFMFVDGGAAGLGIGHQTALDSFLAVIFGSPVGIGCYRQGETAGVQTSFIHHVEHLGHTFANPLFIGRIADQIAKAVVVFAGYQSAGGGTFHAHFVFNADALKIVGSQAAVFIDPIFRDGKEG